VGTFYPFCVAKQFAVTWLLANSPAPSANPSWLVSCMQWPDAPMQILSIYPITVPTLILHYKLEIRIAVLSTHISMPITQHSTRQYVPSIFYTNWHSLNTWTKEKPHGQISTRKSDLIRFIESWLTEAISIILSHLIFSFNVGYSHDEFPVWVFGSGSPVSSIG